MPEPVITNPPNGQPGRPAISDEQYAAWLQDLKPHLEYACSLYRACVKAGLEDKYDSCILEKYNSGDWFSRKVDAYRASAGEDGNEAEVRIVKKVLTNLKTETPVSDKEMDILKHFNEKHRTAQPFFSNRNENADVTKEDLGKIKEILGGDYGEFGKDSPTSGAGEAPTQ